MIQLINLTRRKIKVKIQLKRDTSDKYSTMLKLEVSINIYFLNQSNFYKSFSLCSPHTLICSWFSEYLCRIRNTIDYMGHNMNARVKPYPEMYLQWTRKYQQDFTDEKVNNQRVRWKQAKLHLLSGLSTLQLSTADLI